MRLNVTDQFSSFRAPIMDSEIDGAVYGGVIVPIVNGLSVLGADASSYPNSRVMHCKSSRERASGLITSTMALSVEVDGIRLAGGEGLPEEDITFEKPINAWSLTSTPDETMLCFGNGLYEYTHIGPYRPVTETAPTAEISRQQLDRIVGRLLGPHIAATFSARIRS